MKCALDMQSSQRQNECRLPLMPTDTCRKHPAQPSVPLQHCRTEISMVLTCQTPAAAAGAAAGAP